MITQAVPAIILRADGLARPTSVPVSLIYRNEDPLAVLIRFTVAEDEDVDWTVGRELLENGLSSSEPHGLGDVRFRQEPGRDMVVGCFHSPEGHADIGFQRSAVLGFLSRTAGEFSRHVCTLDSALEEALEEILADGEGT